MGTARGVITLVQEGRFRLAGEQGSTRLFVLSHSASVEPQDLPPLQQARTRVVVSYEEADDTIAAIAHDLRLDQPEDPGGRA